MEESFAREIVHLLVGTSPALLVVILALLIFFPEKIEKWSALLWRLISAFARGWQFVRRKYVKHDLQGRVNDFVRRKLKGVPGVFDAKLELQWVDPNEARSTLLAEGKIILRLRSTDPEDHNFVHASYLFVTASLLPRAKRYLSGKQREALDLFVTSKLLKEEKPHVVGFFLDEYLHPKLQQPQSRLGSLLNDFEVVDDNGLFFPVFVQELEFIGDKVFGRRKDTMIAGEVNDLVEFLKHVAEREIGDIGDLDFEKSYCRCSIMLIGKPAKLLQSIRPYVEYVSGYVIPHNLESLYLIARKESRRKIDQICSAIRSDYVVVRRILTERPLRHKDRVEMAQQYIVVLRKRRPTLMKQIAETRPE